jgi:S-formylglutathione hydrolase FrmB
MKKLIGLLVILSLTWTGFAANVDTIAVMSKSMHKSILNIVVTPDHYSKQGKQLPVLYLLHGAGGNQKDWIKNVPEIKEYADLYNFIIVCPDGNSTSWYFDSPVDSTMKYETYVAKELVDFIDHNYQTIKSTSGRAITGLSMGGHGALYLSFRHQDIFGAAGSMSGGVDIRPFPKNWEIAKRLGNYDQNPQNWDKNTVINLVDLLKGGSLKIIFDCGVDDFFYTVNRNLHQKLLENKIPHDYIERPGKHTWDYWKNSIKYQALFFSDFFKSAAAL